MIRFIFNLVWYFWVPLGISWVSYWFGYPNTGWCLFLGWDVMWLTLSFCLENE